ncbi:MAG: HlyD family efflux transporter periplasmic adaptor subunit [Bacteroidetes bacterium]|nr:MAG: HlyD family efflux transporter periplasmic adaptor subunit [Bacteroidota bacterium]
MARKIIIIVVAIGIVAGGFILSGKLADSKKPPAKKKEKNVTTVFTTTVQNGNVPVQLNATGKLMAKNRIDLFAEVQGIMLDSDAPFKAGQSFGNGALLVRMDSDVFRATLKAQKSNLLNLISAALADLKLDYPEHFNAWEAYVKSFDVEKPVAELPQVTNEKERMFLTGRNIYSTYYNLKNAELTLAKYSIQAPFSGVLVEALVQKGTLVRPGQKLGTFIDPSVYELETPVPLSMLRFMQVGEKVELHSSDTQQKWVGTVTRINSMVNSGTQTVNVYIEVNGKGLEEGMFLEAVIDASQIENAFEIDRSVLFDENQVYVAVDTLLQQKQVEPLYFNQRTVVVSGLNDGDQILTRMPPGAYPGMRISIYGQE